MASSATPSTAATHALSRIAVPPDEGEQNTTGTWTPLAGVGAQRVDLSPGWGLYASKDFHDPVKDRRILWGWLTTVDYGIQSLPRVLHFHPQLRQLTFNPAEEQDALRIMPPLQTSPPMCWRRARASRWIRAAG